MKLVAQMVGYNEADRHLEEVLDHLRTITDHIVFTDDCSTDNTAGIANSYGCYVYETPEQLFIKHEGQLRQLAWRNLEQHAERGDWVLAIDCDEKLFVTGQSLDALMKQRDYLVLGVEFYHMWNKTQYRVDKAWRPNVSSRMFRFTNNGTFNQRRLACGSEPEYVQQWIRRKKFLPYSGLKMQHLGYEDDADKLAKYVRYSTLDRGDFHAMAHIESIIDPNPELVDWSV